MIFGERADPEQRGNHRHTEPLGEQPQLFLGPGERDPVTGQDERLFGPPQESGGGFYGRGEETGASASRSLR